MLNILAAVAALGVAPVDTLPATDIDAATIQETAAQALAQGVTDIPVRTVDAGGHNVGLGVVHRQVGVVGGSASHDHVSEVYHILEGSGTLVTGGAHLDPKRRASGTLGVTQINGPGVSGRGISGGVSRVLEKGDVVIIPAGTVHWWSEVTAPLTYTIIRVDPHKVIDLK